jgi:hypothetical protein
VCREIDYRRVGALFGEIDLKATVHEGECGRIITVKAAH